MSLFPLLLVPLVVGAYFKTEEHKKFTWVEFFILEAVMVVLILGGFQYAKWYSLRDFEITSGTITAKNSGTQKCCHCHRKCDTCRDAKGHTYSCRCTEVCSHFQDYWWSLDVSTGDRISISTCSASSRAPAAWTAAFVGEPASVERGYSLSWITGVSPLRRRRRCSLQVERMRSWTYSQRRGKVALIVTAIRCPNCKATVFSRARHDMRWCPCGSVAIDGGFEYTRVAHNTEIENLETFRIRLPEDLTKTTLFTDWNLSLDQYGVMYDQIPNHDG